MVGHFVGIPIYTKNTVNRKQSHDLTVLIVNVYASKLRLLRTSVTVLVHTEIVYSATSLLPAFSLFSLRYLQKVVVPSSGRLQGELVYQECEIYGASVNGDIFSFSKQWEVCCSIMLNRVIIHNCSRIVSICR